RTPADLVLPIELVRAFSWKFSRDVPVSRRRVRILARRNSLKTTRHAVAAATLILATAALAADTPKQKPAAEPPKLVENIDVRVINLDVVVTDKRGNRIHGLKKEDFEIFENGVPKTISNFYEVESTPKSAATAPTPAAAPAQPMSLAAIEQIPDNQKRRIIFYVDNLSLMPFNRN